MAETKPTVKAADKAEDTSLPVVGQVLTAEAFEAMRKQLVAEIKADSGAAVFSIPGSADSADVGLHEQLKADIPTDLMDAEVPKGSVAVFCAQDVRAVLPSGSTYIFVANAVKHVPKCDEIELRKFGVARYVKSKG